jgi:D-glycero-alpha-D-manno-heptose-7-phosphate kinase
MGVTVTMESQAPKGSGLGASSALLMALLHALNGLRESGERLTSPAILDLGANLEAQVIGIPTGKQDYFPPIWGGVSAMWFDVDGWRVEKLSEKKELVPWLNERVIVTYTSVPHDSAITNWAMLKRYIEHESDAVARMRDIKAIASSMRDALRILDHQAFVNLLDDEWQLRRGLAEGVSTPEIEEYMRVAHDAGAGASKICGAGGGGCMITVAEPERVSGVREAMTRAGARVMDASVVSDGLRTVVA